MWKIIMAIRGEIIIRNMKVAWGADVPKATAVIIIDVRRWTIADTAGTVTGALLRVGEGVILIIVVPQWIHLE